MNEDPPLHRRLMAFGILVMIAWPIWIAFLIWFLSIRPLDAHGWYEDLVVPGTEGNGDWKCCGDNDCQPYPHRTTPGEQAYELFIQGKWWPVPMDRVVGMYSPDERAHACCLALGRTAEQGQGCGHVEPICRDGECQMPFRCVVLPGRSS